VTHDQGFTETDATETDATETDATETDAHQGGPVGDADARADVRIDEPGDGEEHLVDEAELDAVETALAAVGSALDRLADGTYGACEICNRPVADEVLAADPTASRCPEHLPLP
jgi:RNA polymerase-binding transcription factor DksA